MQEERLATAKGDVSLSLHGDSDRVVALGHGAGGTRTTPALVEMAEALAASGRRALLFNFPYSEAKKRRPDPPAVLEATVVAVAAHARERWGARRLVLGGRSMGGRIASQAVAGGLAADGLVFLAYPLHPPGRPDQLRDRHLQGIAVPMLFVQGTRDDFARPDLRDAVLARLGDRAVSYLIEGGDHSFRVLRRSGLSAAAVREEVTGAVLGFLDARGL